MTTLFSRYRRNLVDWQSVGCTPRVQVSYLCRLTDYFVEVVPRTCESFAILHCIVWEIVTKFSNDRRKIFSNNARENPRRLEPSLTLLWGHPMSQVLSYFWLYSFHRGLRSSLFCNVTRGGLVAVYQTFEAIFRSCLQGSSIPTFSWIAWPLKRGPIGCPQTSVKILFKWTTWRTNSFLCIYFYF
jgi:hypothetical protein